jgi:hypothetical protein
MHRPQLIALAAGALTVGLTAGAAVAAAAPAGTRTLSFRESDAGSRFHIIDEAPMSTSHAEPTASLGDQVVLTIPLLKGKRVVGAIHGTCMITAPRRTFEDSTSLCRTAAVLRGGQIVFEGVLRGGTPTFAITGGTGAYAGARGTFTSREQRGGAVDTFVLLP